MEGHVLAGPGAQAPAEMDLPSVNRLECGQGCLFVPLVFLSDLPPTPPQRGSQAGQEPRLAFPEHWQREGADSLASCFSGIPETVPLSAVNRQCSSGLQAVASIAGKL